MFRGNSKKTLPKLKQESSYLITEIEDFEEKRKNPFWVPKPNTEVFNLKDMLNTEKKLQTKGKNKKLSNKPNLTQLNIEIGAPNMRRAYTAKKIDLDEKNGTAKTILEKLRSGKSKQKNEKVEEEYIENLKEKTKMLNRGESVRSFISNTKAIILSKYELEIKKERFIQLQEAYDNEIDAVNYNMVAMEDSKKLFKDNFKKNFESYIKVLREKQELERNNLNTLLKIKLEKEGQIKQEENKINKIKEEKLDKYGDFKNFINCVKTQVQYNPERYLKESEMLKIKEKEAETLNLLIRTGEGILNTTENTTLSNLITMHKKGGDSYNDINANALSSFYLTEGGKQRIRGKARMSIMPSLQKRASMNINIGEKDEKGTITYNDKIYYDDPEPYQSYKDLLDDFKVMENDNIKFILEFNANDMTLFKLNQDIEKLTIQGIKQEREEQLDNEMYDTMYKEIVVYNKKLKNDKELWEHQTKLKKSTKLSFNNTKLNTAMIMYFDPTKVIMNVKKLCSRLFSFTNSYLLTNPRHENLKLKLKILPYYYDDKVTLLEFLKYIELIVDYMESRFNYLKETKPKKLKEMEGKLKEDKNKKKSRDLLTKQTEIAEENKRKLFEKYEKVYPMQKRKVMLKSRPIMKTNKLSKKDLNDNVLKIEDLLGIEPSNNKESSSYAVVNTIN